MAFDTRDEGLTLLRPIASTSEHSEDVPASLEELNLQKMSGHVSVLEQDYLCIWDAFHKLESLLLDSTEPATSDLVCLAYLEDRLTHLFSRRSRNVNRRS